METATKRMTENRNRQPKENRVMCKNRIFTVLYIGIAGLAMLGQTALADFIWDGGGDGSDWFDGANWEGGSAPVNVGTNHIRIRLDGANVTVDSDTQEPTMGGLYLADTGNTATLNIKSSMDPQWLLVGRDGGNGVVNHTVGDFVCDRAHSTDSDAFYVALGAGATGSYTISGGSLTVQGTMYVDKNSESDGGRFTVQGSGANRLLVDTDGNAGSGYEQGAKGVWEVLVDDGGITKLEIDENATFADGAVLEADFLSGFGPYNDTWTVMDVGGTVTGDDLLSLSASSGWSMDWDTTSTPGRSLLTVTHIPEPTTALLVLAGGLLVLLHRKRRQV